MHPVLKVFLNLMGFLLKTITISVAALFALEYLFDYYLK